MIEIIKTNSDGGTSTIRFEHDNDVIVALGELLGTPISKDIQRAQEHQQVNDHIRQTFSTKTLSSNDIRDIFGDRGRS